MYSQNNEDNIILDFFKEKSEGILLDIGAFNGILYSNSRALIEKNWSAFLVEGSSFPFTNLFNLYKDNPKIVLINAIISMDENIYPLKMYESPNSLVSTIDQEHFEHWKHKITSFNHPQFREIFVPTLSFKNLLSWIKSKNVSLDYITIDVEGFSGKMSLQLNPDEFNTKLIVIEHDGFFKEIYNYYHSFGFKTLQLNNENIILGRD